MLLKSIKLSSMLVLDILSHFLTFLLILKHVHYRIRMSQYLFELLELNLAKFFFVISRKEVHIIVSIGSPLLFGCLCNAFDFLLLLSLAQVKFFCLLLCNKRRVPIRENKILRSDLR
jgi:hypothetical protein